MPLSNHTITKSAICVKQNTCALMDLFGWQVEESFCCGGYGVGRNRPEPSLLVLIKAISVYFGQLVSGTDFRCSMLDS